MRRYDIDWIRVIAIGLLIVYHAAVCFQPWGVMIGFITNKDPWMSLWMPMAILNVWRIPLLFFVSGMGVYFAMQSRTWLELISERSRRIMIPYLFGMFVVIPIQTLIWRYNAGMEMRYTWLNPSHLWFLGNIMAYVVIFFTLFYAIRKNGDFIKRIFSTPFGILIVMAFLMGEMFITKPYPYELYAMTLHGFVLGLVAFFFGWIFAFTGTPFWNMITKWWWALLTIAVTACYLRLGHGILYLIPIESVSWICLVLVLGYKFLNKESNALRYLSEAAYPVYIVHMIFQFLGSMLIFPLAIPVEIKFVLLVLFTLAGSLGAYQLIKQTNVTRFVFGLKPKRAQP